jgi:hypothetical protein
MIQMVLAVVLATVFLEIDPSTTSAGWDPGPAKVSEEQRVATHTQWGIASAYGPCCDVYAPGRGMIFYERPGVNMWHYMWPWEASIASPWWWRGTSICIEIPAHPNAWGETMREHGYTQCTRPLTPEQVGDPLHPGRGELTISDHMPAYHDRMLDVSVGFLRDLNFCDPEWSDYWCARYWGTWPVRMYVFA